MLQIKTSLLWSLWRETSKLKELLCSLRILKILAQIFQVRGFYTVLIFSILNNACSLVAYYYLFSVYLSQ